jgi:hypothetical protein
VARIERRRLPARRRSTHDLHQLDDPGPTLDLTFLDDADTRRVALVLKRSGSTA